MTEAAGFKVVAPSTVAAGEEFTLRVKVLTHPYVVPWSCYQGISRVAGPFNRSPRGIQYMDNVPVNWRGRIEFDLEGGIGPESFRFDGAQGVFPGDSRPIARIPEPFRFDVPGIHTITVRDPKSGVCGVSNPIHVTATAPEFRLYWGDPHSQTFFSDGLRCPEELCDFARDEGFLDFFAVSDHAEWITDAQWRYFTDVANAWNQPREFVTLIGLEWTSGRFGHRNVYYPGASGPILRSAGPGAADLDTLYRVARAEGALVVPHHSANCQMGVPWELGHDPAVERLCEIYSIWGNSERPASAGNPRPIRAYGGECPGQHVFDALNMGRRYGLIGGGDIHDGRPGDDLHIRQPAVENYRLLWPQGITGVWARDLTREAVFEALWNRRTFATTNARIVLEFSVNGAPMGSELRMATPPMVRVRTAASAPIQHIEIVRNGVNVHDVRPGAASAGVEWTDPTAAASAAWYAARITCSDGNMAWSSPVWVTP